MMMDGSMDCCHGRTYYLYSLCRRLISCGRLCRRRRGLRKPQVEKHALTSTSACALVGAITS